jgi:dTDP-4-amino-4,6-dideoxygalactose transaminase
VYGNPCDVEAIEAIAKKHQLKVIYDAAHCFGVTYKGQSIFNYGDVSTCSFHATKLFHCGEGGALFCQDEETLHEMWYRHNFGHNGPEEYHGLGINAKMSELQAAMGLSVLPYIEHIIKERRHVCEFYDTTLNFSTLKKLKLRPGTEWNYAYYPIMFNSEEELLKTIKRLEKKDIFPRRYFYPSLENLPYVDSNSCINAEDIAKKIICLPLFVGLSIESLKEIVDLINGK